MDNSSNIEKWYTNKNDYVYFYGKECYMVMDQPTSNKKLAPISQATSQIPSSQETLTLILNLVFALSLFLFYKYKVKIQIRYNEDPLLLFIFLLHCKPWQYFIK